MTTSPRGAAIAAFTLILSGLLLVVAGWMATTMSDASWMEWGGYSWLTGVVLNAAGLLVAAVSARQRRQRVRA